MNDDATETCCHAAHAIVPADAPCWICRRQEEMEAPPEAPSPEAGE